MKQKHNMFALQGGAVGSKWQRTEEEIWKEVQGNEVKSDTVDSPDLSSPFED